MAIDKERLRKLLLVVLSSDQAGEAMAARDAVAKMLKKDGKDIHWLVAQVAGQPPKPAVPSVQHGAASPTPESELWWNVIVYCADHIDWLRPKEAVFIQSLMQQFVDSTKDNWRPSPAQTKWLNDIYRRLLTLEARGFK